MLLNDILHFAKTQIPFYQKRIIDSDYSSFPYITKKTINNHLHSMISKDIVRLGFSALALCHTSGTTGEPTIVYWQSNDLLKADVNLWRWRFHYYGITPSSPCLLFYDNEFKRKSSLFGINIQDILKNDFATAFLSLIRKEKIEWIRVQPSILRIISEKIEGNLNLNHCCLKLIETTGEVLTEEERSYYSNLFKVPVADLYGSEETRAIAYSCPCGKKHILTENVFVETINSNSSGMGEAVVTVLNNTAMPLIKYNLQDLIKIELISRCPCGNNSPVITNILGRSSRCIYSKNGVLYSESLINHRFEAINNDLGHPIQMYRVQYFQATGVFEINVSLRSDFDGWKEVVRKRIISQFTGEDKTIVTFSDLKNVRCKNVAFEVMP